MDANGVIQIVPSLKGNTRDLPQEGMTLGEHMYDKPRGTGMRRHRSTREGIDIESSEKSLQAKTRSNVTLYMQDVYATTRGGACGGTWNLPNQMTGRRGDISKGV